MSFNKRIKIKHLLENPTPEENATVMGWVRTKRSNKHVTFIAINDGSCIQNYQCVADPELIPDDVLRKANTGACLKITGTIVASQGAGQSTEIQAVSIVVLGEADPDKFPIQPKKHSLEFLRENAHLRLRTNTFGAIFRVRNQLSFAIHQYFHEKGFVYIHSPIVTASDAEGAGETFQVTTLDLNNPPKNEAGEIDFQEDFFGRATNLTVSGQLEGELAAMALSEVYTFGPTFRAENSNTTRHLAEFWMVEPEMAFFDAEDNQNLAEDFLQFIIGFALKHCKEDLEFLDKRAAEEDSVKKADQRSDMGLLERLSFVTQNEFVRITYTEAFEILKASKPNKKKKFAYLIEEWGTDLQSEHERFLVEKHFKKPVIITDYPKEIKSFYMKQNEDGKTVAAMDILFPGIGEIVGGSQREENLEKLCQRMDELEISKEEMWWYLDTRKFGTAPHAGFGLGFERLVLFVTGMSNIRDVIPFPRTPGNAEF
ncbi:asparagine--tRNA ligase [Cyclobacterium qasimii]|uniref:Asparagine--tRNA ligase n=2 Tax=Cyclobacterium qasimii TaxID=1350429 RepID=S7WNX0_9BACT|nr:asparagine--tRNA ligase [Cyclobacterium qasimii]EPR68414.1 Asparaginyl-tRNA synthetase [Cyclobacterium qasimii M12-11B]GEO23747.1 asparagine--tRNA ligase [Cyclobacterium qasimii]